MQRILSILSTLIILIAANSCNSLTGSSNYQAPDVPKELQSIEERGNFLARHYWDKSDFADRSMISDKQDIEQAIVNYLEILRRVDTLLADSSLNALLGRMEKHGRQEVYSYFQESLKRHLYEPNSQLRSDALYLQVATFVSRDQHSDIAEKSRAKAIAAVINKNKPGHLASDFHIRLTNQDTTTLRQLQGTPMLLMFYDPDCHTCQEIMETLKTSAAISKAVDGKKLQIVMIYPGTNIDIWNKHQTSIPSTWINGMNPNSELREKELYDLRGFPTLYLLDAHQRVLLKNTDPSAVEQVVINGEI